MSCKCIAKVEKKLKEETGDSEAEIVTGYSFPFNKPRCVKVYIPIIVRYRTKKKDGTFGKIKDHTIRAAYCPFCGKEI